MDTLNEKIKALVDSKCSGDARKFARLIGVSTTTISYIYDGKANAGGKVVLAIAHAMPDVDMNWLTRGQEISTLMAEEPKAAYENLHDYRQLVEKVKELELLINQIKQKID